LCAACRPAARRPPSTRPSSRPFHAQSRDDYALDRDALLRRKHPLTWLRVRRLAGLARPAGLGELADRMEREWEETAGALGVEEEYHGTWDDSLGPAFTLMIGRMLEEAGPPRHDTTTAPVFPFPRSPVPLFTEPCLPSK